MEKNWSFEIESRIDTLMSKSEPAEVRRLQLGYLKTVVSRIERESLKCQKCEYLKADISEALEIIEKAENVTSVQRRAYNTRIKQALSHLKKAHGLISSTHYANKYSLYGFIAGIAMGVWFFDQFIVLVSILLLAPFIGKIIGGFKDYRNKDSDKLI